MAKLKGVKGEGGEAKDEGDEDLFGGAGYGGAFNDGEEEEDNDIIF